MATPSPSANPQQAIIDHGGASFSLRILKKFAGREKGLEAAAMDTSSACYQAVHEAVPHVDVVFDRHHIMDLMNHAAETPRSDQQRALEDPGKESLKGSRFLLHASP